MAGRLYKDGRNDRPEVGFSKAWLSFRVKQAPGKEISRRKAPLVESGTMDTKFHDHNTGIRGPVFCSKLLSDSKNLNAETLLLYAQNSHSPRFWQSSPLRYRNARNSTICSCENGERFGMGICGSLPQSHSKIFETAKKWGYHSGPNPAAGVELPEKTPVREKHILEVEQIPRLLTVLEEPVSTMVRLALLTGLRVGEILALDWASIDFASARIHVRRGYYRGSMSSPKTKCSRRSVPLPEVLRPVLLRLREKATSAEELIFPSRKGTPYNDSNLTHRHLKPAGRRLGMPWLNWHTLRRTHATLFQVAGGSLRDAQAQVGHSKMSTTLELYTLPIPEQQRAAVEKLSALMANDGRNGENPEALPLASQQIQ
jgi:site-specific recombinase XerD